ncbi:MAG: cupin domain-containing protein [Symbiobacteriia bacterium]
MIQKINLTQKFSRFTDHWSPKIVGEVNDAYVKLAKLEGTFDWHRHDAEDELFFVVKGRLVVRLRDQDIELAEGEMVVIPKGVEHQPVAAEEAHVLFLEPKSTLNTGNVRSARTVEKLDWI